MNQSISPWMETRNERLSNKQRALITAQQSAINQWSNCKHQAEMKKYIYLIKVAIIPQTIFFTNTAHLVSMWSNRCCQRSLTSRKAPWISASLALSLANRSCSPSCLRWLLFSLKRLISSMQSWKERCTMSTGLSCALVINTSIPNKTD